MAPEDLSAFGEHLHAALSLDEQACASRVAGPPDWILELQKLYVTQRPADGDPAFLRLVDEGANGFLWLASPLFHDALHRFRDGVVRLATDSAPFDPSVERLLVPRLARTLREALELVMVLELNVARVQGALIGDTPEARFRDFCRGLRQPETQWSIAREYPVLFRALHARTTNWVDTSLELLERLARDWDDIRTHLTDGSDPGRLTSVRMGAGDVHRRGRTVAILELASGLELVYKPHSLAIDLHFEALLQWIDRAGHETQFRVPKKLDRGCYGWSQFAPHDPCSNREQIERFYQRLGGYLAVFYVIRGTDMHHENLLASGEYPVPVDLETLFHPEVAVEVEDPAIEAFRFSVMPVLMLPEGDDGVDTSGFGAKSGQRFPAGRTFSWDRPGTDEMRVARDLTGPIMEATNRPRIDGQEVVAEEFAGSFLTGFCRVYHSIEARRDELIGPGGILDSFADDEVRFIARPTAAYAGLLRPCYQPDRLRSAVARDEVLDGLRLAVAHQPSVAPLIQFEVRDLRGGDVPVFTSRPNSRDLWTSDGERIPAFFERTAMEVVHEGLARMGDEDLARQIEFIRSAIASPEQRTASRKLNTRGRGALDLARGVGDRLCRDALENERHASWLGIGETKSLSPLHLGLYEGLSGCSLFLAYLGAVTGDAGYRRVATKTIALVRRHLDRDRSRGPIQNLGGFTGLGGLVYTLAHLAVLWDDASLVHEAEALAAEMPAMVGEDQTLDVIGGAAGAIAALDVLNRVSRGDDLLRTASLCGAHLVERQQPSGAWATTVDASKPLTGFSHGAAGIAWSLLKLAAWSGEPRFREAARVAITYERSTYVTEDANWPDFRAWPAHLPRQRCQTAWCHGAPGIGLARVDSLDHLDDRATREEIRAALRTTAEGEFGWSHGLCHGDLGNLDVLLHAAQRGDDFWWNEYGRGRADQTMAAIAERGCICSSQSSQAPPGLMTGLAGIGYGLLRLSSPERVPSVLAMAPPPGC